MLLPALFVLLCAALAGGAGVVAYRLHGRLIETGTLLLRSAARQAELRRSHDNRVDFLEAQQLAEGVVEGGTRIVQGVHQGIAAIPFGILEAIPPTRPAARVVRIAHDLIAGSVYGSISLANRGLGRLLRGAGPPSGREKQ